MELNRYIDHTILKAATIEADVKSRCDEAKEYGFFSVCVNASNVAFVAEQLKGSNVKVCSVIGYPLGAMTTETKVFEAQDAIAKGADEIDMVINVAWLKEGKLAELQKEIEEIKDAIGDHVLKVIMENCYLEKEEIVAACLAAVAAKADFVKTSTGMASGGATVEDVQLMLDTVEGKAKVKASGGIRNYETAKKYIDMGVARIGASSGVKIVTGGEGNPNDY